MASSAGPPSSKRRKLNAAEEKDKEEEEKEHEQSEHEGEEPQSHPEDAEAAAVLALAKQADQLAASHEATLTSRTERGILLEYVVSWFNKCQQKEEQHAILALAMRLALYKNIIRLLTLPVVAHDPLTDKLGQVLLTQMTGIQEKGRGYLMEVLIHNLESSTAIHPILLELLPRLLDLTASSQKGPSNATVWTVPQAGLGGASVRSVAASVYRTSVIQRLCELDWQQRVGLTLSEEAEASQMPQPQSTSVLLLHILRCFKQLELTSEEHTIVIRTAVKSLKSAQRAVPLVEAPAVFHSLLALSGQGEKPRILKAMLDYFESAEAEVEAEDEQQSQWGGAEETIALRAASLAPLLQAEGTTLLHASLAFSRDLKWSKAIERFYLSNLPPVGNATFRWALLLAAARSLHSSMQSAVHLPTQRSGQALYDLLKKLMTNAIQQNWQPIRSSDLSANDFVSVVPLQVEVGWEAQSWPALSKALLLCVDRAHDGAWDAVLESLVDFAGQILDVAPSDWTKRLLAQWGCQLACRLFTHAEQTRPAILDAILTNLIAQSQSGMSYMSILSAIVQQSAHSVLQLEDKLREAMNYCSVLPQPSLVAAFVRAIAPLLTLRPPLRDQLLLILRKALFSRAEETRRVACSALTTLLCCNKHSPFNEQHALEVVDLLKRCLTQQLDVRKQLYEDAQRYLVFSRRAHSQSTKHVAELLESHLLNRYLYSLDNDAAACVDLDACFGARQANDTFLQEPLPLLLRTLTSLAVIYPDLHIRQTLLRLSQRLSKSELEQFELDKTSDFDPQTSNGERNHRRASLLLQVIEVCMETVARLTDLSAPNSTSPPTIVSLSKIYFHLKATVKEGTPKHGKSNKAKAVDDEGLEAESDDEEASNAEEGAATTHAAKKKATALSTPSALSEEGVHSLLRWLLPQPVPAVDVALAQHVLHFAYLSLRSANRVVGKDPAQWVLWEMQNAAGHDDEEIEKRPNEELDLNIYQTLSWIRFCRNQAPSFWKEFFSGWESAREAPAGGRNASVFTKSAQTLSLDCFYESVKLFLSLASSRSDRDTLTAQFFEFSLPRSRSKDNSSRPVHCFMDEVWRLVPLVAEQNMMHECEQLIDTLGMLHPLLTERELEDHITNATAFTMSDNANPIFARRAMRLFWTMQLRGDETLDCLRQFAEQIKLLWGDSTADATTPSATLSPGTPDFSIITDRTAPALFSELLSMLDQQLDQITTWLTSLKRRQPEQQEPMAANNDDVLAKPNKTSRKAKSKLINVENAQIDEMDIDQESSDESSSSARHRVCGRSLGISGCLEVMLYTAVKPPGVDGLFKVVLRFYRVLDLLAKDLLSLKKQPPDVFDRLVTRVGGSLSPKVGSFIMFVNNQLSGVISGTTDEVVWVKFAAKGGKKVASVVPKITEAIERFETVDLAAMETKLPNVKYRHLLKRSAARDFKIKVNELGEMQPKSRKPTSKRA